MTSVRLSYLARLAWVSTINRRYSGTPAQLVTNGAKTNCRWLSFVCCYGLATLFKKGFLCMSL
ncbi:MAG: hypothetical protein RLZZ410_902 [Pseudomonadota bacterium]|jgi:hypothetical protein